MRRMGKKNRAGRMKGQNFGGRGERKEEREMADIAMLVAEEYERRMKIAKKMMGSEAAAKLEMGFVSIRGLNKEFNWVSSELMHVRVAVNRVLEPRTQMGVEALSGFFSA